MPNSLNQKSQKKLFKQKGWFVFFLHINLIAALAINNSERYNKTLI